MLLKVREKNRLWAGWALFVVSRSDGRVVYRVSASGSMDLGFDSESGQTNDFKIGIHSFPA